MNLESLFRSVIEDEKNSALISICNELHKQGYEVKINGIDINFDLSKETLLIEDLERLNTSLKFVIRDENKVVDKFLLSFTDYHSFCLEKYK